MPTPNSISISQLYRLIGTKDCPVIIDVRLHEDFKDDPRTIPCAVKRQFDDINSIIKDFSGKNIVIYCQKGFKISQGTAALLRSAGQRAEFLEAGHFGWRDADLPMIKTLETTHKNPIEDSLWVTRHRPKIDRIACPWLIRRFIDPVANFLFVEPSQVLNVADRFNATPFDIEGVKFSHHGDFCSFDALISEFGLCASQPLNALAQIVRAADTNHHEIAKEAAGLLAISVGLSRIYHDDLDQVEAGMEIYDALYRWARDAKDESHSSLSNHLSK